MAVIELASNVQFSTKTCKIRNCSNITCLCVHIRSLLPYPAVSYAQWHVSMNAPHMSVARSGEALGEPRIVFFVESALGFYLIIRLPAHGS